MKLLFVLDYEYFGNEYLDVARAASQYCDMIWFRIKNIDDRLIYDKAALLRERLPEAKLVLSARPDIAVCAGFDGVHLNSASIPSEYVSSFFPMLITGFSTHSASECIDIKTSYRTFSPIFHTAKPYDYPPVGAVPAPAKGVYAMGGINAGTIGQLKGLGYEGVAGITLFKDIKTIYKLVKEMN